jgi:hypothetical protein
MSRPLPGDARGDRSLGLPVGDLPPRPPLSAPTRKLLRRDRTTRVTTPATTTAPPNTGSTMGSLLEEWEATVVSVAMAALGDGVAVPGPDPGPESEVEPVVAAEGPEGGGGGSQ